LPLFAVLAVLCLGAAPGDFPAPGRSRTEIEGCLAKEGKRAFTPPVARGNAPKAGPVQVEKFPSGIVVTHHLDHACCLKGGVATTVEPGVVAIIATLSGEPCRCPCSSTLTTTVGLVPGIYRVKVEVQNGKKTSTVYDGPISLP
jgi:hypothetical protein